MYGNKLLKLDAFYKICVLFFFCRTSFFLSRSFLPCLSPPSFRSFSHPISLRSLFRLSSPRFACFFCQRNFFHQLQRQQNLITSCHCCFVCILHSSRIIPCANTLFMPSHWGFFSSLRHTDGEVLMHLYEEIYKLTQLSSIPRLSAFGSMHPFFLILNLLSLYLQMAASWYFWDLWAVTSNGFDYANMLVVGYVRNVNSSFKRALRTTTVLA